MTRQSPFRRGVRRASENRWARFTVRRTGRLLVSLWVLVTAAFLMIHVIPGDPVRAALGPTAPPSSSPPGGSRSG